MSCTDRASAEGRFLLEVRDYITGRTLEKLFIQGLEPHAQLDCEVLEGNDEE